MPKETLKKLEAVIVERMELQRQQDVEALENDSTFEPYSEAERIAFALEEAWLNEELDFLCEVAYYQCKDEECQDPHTKKRTTSTRDADTLQEAGDPYCFVCDGEMEGITAKNYQELNTH
jgi:hypothetical protein